MPQIVGPVWAALEAAWAFIGPIGQAVATAAISYGASSLAADAALNGDNARGSIITLQKEVSSPRRLQIGKGLNGGLLVDWYTEGAKNGDLWVPVYLSEGPCGRLTKMYANGRVVYGDDPDEEPPLVHGVKTEVVGFRSGQNIDIGERLFVTYYDGRTGQTADPDLVAHSDGDWTSANKMTGCAYVVIHYRYDSDNQRTPAGLSFELDGAKIYDRRKDTTAGGSGSHRYDDPDTWEISDGEDTEGANPMVALDHFLLGRRWGGKKVFGVGAANGLVPFDQFVFRANICDEDVDLKVSGQQKRYRASGIVFASDDFETTIKKLSGAMACRPSDNYGRYSFIGSETRTPVLEIEDGDLLKGGGEFYAPKKPWDTIFSGVEGRYREPDQLYQQTDYPRYTNDVWIADDDQERYITQSFDFEINSERAQRLAMIFGNTMRRQGTLRGVYEPWVAELERGDWFLRTGLRWGVDGKLFEVLDRNVDPKTGAVTLVAEEADPNDTLWDEALAGDPPRTPTPGSDVVLAIDPPVIVATSVSLVGTSFAKPAIRVEWSVPDDMRIRWLYIEIWPTGDADQKMAATIAIPSDITFAVFDQGIVDGVDYTVRARFMGITLQSGWSTTSTITPTSGLTIGGKTGTEIADELDINAEGILHQILLVSTWQAANEALLWIGGETVGEISVEARMVSEGAVGDISLIGTRNMDASAFILDLDTVTLPGTGGSSALSLRTLRSEHDGNFSQVAFLMNADDAGAAVRLSLDVDGYINGLYLWNGGSPMNSGIAFLTDNFAIVSPGDGLTTPFVPFAVVGGVVKMASVEIDTLKVDTIVTNHIQVNQVTEPFKSVDTTDVTIPSDGTYIEVHSVDYENAGATFEINCFVGLKRNSGGRCFYQLNLMKDGVQYEERLYADLFPFATNIATVRETTFLLDDVTPGNYTWSLEVLIYDGNGGVSGWAHDFSTMAFRDYKR